MYESFAYDHLYSTWAWPAWLAAVGVLVCIAASILAAVQAERGKVWVLPLALLPLAALALLGLGLAPPFIGAELGQAEALMDAGPRPWRVFRQLLLADLGIWAAALGATGLGAMLRCILGGTPRVESLAPPAAVAALGLLLAAVGPVHAAVLLAAGPLPTLHATEGARVHVGRSLDLEPSVGGIAEPGRCEVRPVLFAPEEPGEAWLRLQARCGMAGVERQIVAYGGEDRGPALFPLAVGHSWTWRHLRDAHNHMLWFFPEHHHYEGPDLHLRVELESQGEALHSWTLREWTDGGEEQLHELYRWDGHLLWMIDGRPGNEPFFALDEPLEGEPQVHPAEGDTPAWRACSLGIFPRMDCRCLLEPQGDASLGGPTLCTRPPGAGDDLRALGSAFLAVITVGLVIVDPDQDPRWVLVRSGTTPAPQD